MAKYKLKTKKSISKRFRATGKGKLMRRSVGQDHFNARNTGDAVRGKRKDKSLADSDKQIKKQLPYI